MNLSPRITYNDSDVELLARIMKSEALGEGDEGMLMVGNVIVNRVVANCDVFKNTRNIYEVVYQKNAFAGVDQPLFNQPVNAKERELALRNIDGYRVEPAYEALWFKNPGSKGIMPRSILWKSHWSIQKPLFLCPWGKIKL